MAKVALRFGCAEQSKNLERYLIDTYIVRMQNLSISNYSTRIFAHSGDANAFLNRTADKN